MKLKLLIATLFLSTSFAHATGNGNNGNTSTSSTANSSANAGAVGLGVGVGIGGSATGGSVGNTNLNNTTEAGDYDDLKIPPLAIAPSVSNTVICPMVSQGSKAVSLWPISLSGTHAPEIVAICVAYHLNQADVVQAIACNQSKEYAKANPACVK